MNYFPPKWLYYFTFPPAVCEFWFHYILANTWESQSLILGMITVLITYCGLNWYFSNAYMILNIFSGATCHPYAFFSCLLTLLPILKRCFTFILFFFFFLSCHTACRIPVPQPGIEPIPPAVETWGLNHWTARAVLSFAHFYWVVFFFLSSAISVF